MTRKMASIRIIEELLPIEGADLIEIARIGGWKVVVKKGEYSVGSLCVYCEIDSFIPTEVAPFLTKSGHSPKEYNGVQGERLKTIKLRGQLSQGLILPVDLIKDLSVELTEGNDVSEALGIQKWEPPVGFSSSDAKGNFPAFFPKTDQERIQNISKPKLGVSYEVTEKLEGQSFSAYYDNSTFGVCSRNLELKDSPDGTFWNTARKYNLQEKLTKLNINLVIQGEQVGSGIQGNIYKFNDVRLYVYDIYFIDEQRYATPSEVRKLCNDLELLHVPVKHTEFYLPLEETCDKLLALAEGTSELYNTEQEGVVYKANTEERYSFKVISNKYLIKQK